MAVGGAAAFWLTNLAISLTPIAAQYRAALSISYVPMLLEALVGGLVLGSCVSVVLLRWFYQAPGTTPMAKALVLSSTAILLVTVLVEVPAKLETTASDPWRLFLIGLLFNALRITALGVVAGYLCAGLGRHANT